MQILNRCDFLVINTTDRECPTSPPSLSTSISNGETDNGTFALGASRKDVEIIMGTPSSIIGEHGRMDSPA
jgi:hypothetical protein